MKGFRTSTMILVLMAAMTLLCMPRAHAASLWQATSLSVGGAGRWLHQDGAQKASDFEGIANVALSLTPHVSITGGVAHGLNRSYTREYVDARITATDPNRPDFNIWIGAGRYFSAHEGDGLDEYAGKAGIGWTPLAGRPFIVGLTSGVGFDTGRAQTSVSLTYGFKLVKE